MAATASGSARSILTNSAPATSSSSSSVEYWAKRPRLHVSASDTGSSSQSTSDGPFLDSRHASRYASHSVESPPPRSYDFPRPTSSYTGATQGLPAISMPAPFGGLPRPELPPLDPGRLARLDRGGSTSSGVSTLASPTSHLHIDGRHPVDSVMSLSQSHPGRSPSRIDERESSRRDATSMSGTRLDLLYSDGLSTNLTPGFQWWGPTSFLAVQDRLQKLLTLAEVPTKPGQGSGVWRWKADVLM